MADEVLSQAEVESLLTSMESGQPKSAPVRPQPAAPKAPARPREKITPYDFRRPERVGKEQMRALQSLHEGFGRNFGAALSALLRSMVDVKLTSVDQLTYGEFVFSLENPSCFNLLRAAPLEGNLILDINPAILYPIIDRLLGGGKDVAQVTRRPLTEIELRLVSRISSLFLIELRKAWEGVVLLEMSVERVESNPQLVQIVPPNEVVVVVSFELTVGDTRGMINLCIPYNSIERIGNKLTSNSWVTYGKAGATPASISELTRRIDHAAVPLTVMLAETRISTGDLVGLRVGDIITTDQDVRAPLAVEVAGVVKFHCSAGAFKGRKAVKIETPLPSTKPPAK